MFQGFGERMPDELTASARETMLIKVICQREIFCVGWRSKPILFSVARDCAGTPPGHFHPRPSPMLVFGEPAGRASIASVALMVAGDAVRISPKECSKGWRLRQGTREKHERSVDILPGSQLTTTLLSSLFPRRDRMQLLGSFNLDAQVRPFMPLFLVDRQAEAQETQRRGAQAPAKAHHVHQE